MRDSLVSKRHLQLLDCAFFFYGVLSDGEDGSVVRMLLDDNMRSVKQRLQCPEHWRKLASLADGYSCEYYPMTRKDLCVLTNPLHMKRLIDWYVVHTQDLPDWESSYSFSLLQELECRLIATSGLSPEEFVRQARLTDVWSISFVR